MSSRQDQDYDPKLKEAMQKIEDICSEYEVGYLCVVSSKTHTEYKCDFPVWSLIQNDKGGVRVKTKSSDPELTNSSFHLLLSIRDVAGMFFANFQEVVESLKDKIEINHEPFGGSKKASTSEKLPTKERLARALETENDPRLAPLVVRARQGYYDDYESELAAPIITLVADLRGLGLEAFAQRVIDGEFDGIPEESEAWFQKEGKHYLLSELGHKAPKRHKPNGFG